MTLLSWGRYRFTTLLCVLVALLATAPLLGIWERGRFPDIKGALFIAVFSGLLISAVCAVAPSRRVQRIAWCLAIATIVLKISEKALGGVVLDAAGYLSGALFLGLIVVLIVRIVFTSRRADMDTIAGSLCAYMLLGILWAVLYSLAEAVRPGSFRLPAEGELMSFDGEHSTTPLYFSYVTLTTLGFGDVTPVTAVARMLVVIETLVGQIYLIVLVSRLVGINVSESAPAAPTSPQDPS